VLTDIVAHGFVTRRSNPRGDEYLSPSAAAALVIEFEFESESETESVDRCLLGSNSTAGPPRRCAAPFLRKINPMNRPS
jgi:hypothetical protein